MGAYGWIEWVFWAAIAVGVIVRVSVVVRRRRAGGREALREALGPVADAGAAQSTAYGWTPSSSTDLPAAYTSAQTTEIDDRGLTDLPDPRT